MGRIKINTGRPYEVTIEGGLLGEIVEHMAPWQGRKLFILTDDTVEELYEEHLAERLLQAGWKLSDISVKPGEGSKSLSTLEEVLEAMAMAGLNRTGLVIALGGGVVGDLGGFAAATYMRGIDFIQIPTTLLACVDSSVGGKTAVNLKAGKNLAGAFHQPVAVLADPDALGTLPKKVWADGMAEVIKYGVLFDRKLFDRVAKGVTPLDPDLDAIIARCVELKSQVVEQDEKDRGVRQLLNLGHTFGHALERVSDYSISHGHAVAAGMAMMSRACVKRGLCSEETARAIEAALSNNGLPSRNELPLEALRAAIRKDKKASGAHGQEDIHLVTVEAIGTCRLFKVPLDSVGSWLEDSI